MPDFHGPRSHQKKTMQIEAAAALLGLGAGALFNPIFFVFAGLLAFGAGVMWWKMRDPKPLLSIGPEGISARAGAARWEELTGWGIARFGGKRRGKDCFWAETAPGGPEFRLRHPDQMLAGAHQLRIPLAELGPEWGDPAETARAHRPDLERKT